MSISKICDICGKDENYAGTAFDDEPMSINRKNYNGEDIHFLLHMQVDYDEDFKTKQIIEKQLKNKKFNDEDEFMEFVNGFKMKCKTTMICNKCKKEILMDFAKYGNMLRGEDFKKFNEKNPANTLKIKGFNKLLKEVTKIEEKQINNNKVEKDCVKYQKYGAFVDDNGHMFFSEKIDKNGFSELLKLIDEKGV